MKPINHKNVLLKHNKNISNILMSSLMNSDAERFLKLKRELKDADPHTVLTRQLELAMKIFMEKQNTNDKKDK